MNKRLKSILQEDTQYGESRTVRLRKTDDLEIANRSGKASPLIAELVHKGLAYERLEKGAKDTVVRQLLRDLNEIVSHHVKEATAPLSAQLAQTNLFLAASFASFFAGLNYPGIGDLTDAQKNGLYQTCLQPTNQMMDLLRARFHLLQMQSNPQPPANNSPVAKKPS